MSVGYGSNIIPARVLPEQIGITPASKGKSHTGIFRILLTIGELGIVLIPGVGVITETVVGLVGGTLNQVLDKKENNQSGLGTFLNFGAPVIGGAFAGTSNIAKIGRYEAKVASLGEVGSQARILSGASANAARIDKLTAFNKGARGLAQTVDTSGKLSLKTIQAQVETYIKKAGLSLDNVADSIKENLEELNKTFRFTKDELYELKFILAQARNVREEYSYFMSFIQRLSNERASDIMIGLGKTLRTGRLGNQIALAQIIKKRYVVRKLNYTRKFTETTARQNNSLYKSLVRKTGTAKFNRKVVQRAQLIDPNDLGRAPIEFLYQKLKTKFERHMRRVAELLEFGDDVDDAFVKAGGIRLDSTVIRGYKVINNLGIGPLSRNFIMVVFLPGPTNNKPPIFTWLTNAELHEWQNAPSKMTWYKNNIAFSHGRPVNLGLKFKVPGFGTLGPSALSVLGFIPNQALRNTLSIVSNWVENITDLAQGKYFSNYKDKFTKSMRNAVISRTFRMGGRVIAGGYATQAFGKAVGRLIGSELQRVGTQIAAKAIKNAIAGKSTSKGLLDSLEKGALVSVRSNTRRRVRKVRGPNGSAIIATLTARRKMQTVKRIPNAVMPKRPFKGLKFK